MAKKDFPAPEGAPHGTGAALERISRVAPPQPAQPAQPPPAPRVQPFAPRTLGTTLAEEEDISGGYDDVLFGPSDRPNEPLTHGAPFGPGSNFVPLPYEDEYAFRRRIADELDADGSPSLAPFVAKLRSGA